MRIVLVTASPPEIHCGVGDYTANLAVALAVLGDEVTIIRGAPVTGNPIDEPKGHAGTVRVRAVISDWSLASLPKLRRAVLAPRPDVVHIQFPGRGYGRSFAPNLLPWILRAPGRPRLVMTLHEYGFATWKGRLRMLTGALASDALVFPEEGVAAEVRNALGRFHAKPSRVIPIASSIAASDPDLDRAAVREQLAIPSDALAIGWFGRLTRDKGVPVLLAALRMVRVRHRPVLVVVGDVGAPRDARELASALRAELPTIFTGPIPDADVAAVIASMDVIALPFENGLTGRRSSYLAARAQGTYIVTTHTARRDYDSASNTQFVAPDDAAALAAAILDAPNRDRMVGSATVTWTSIASAHGEFYDSL
jgi:glycosyltransferase involved in cell wall biosynthesis